MFYKTLFHSMMLLCALVFIALCAAQTVPAQTTAFNYQGKLSDSGNPANGSYDLQFKLFDTATVGTGTQQGTTVTVSNVSVSNGSFTVQLDFGVCASCFNGAARFLEIAVKLTSGSTFTTLSPRQPVNSTPYAIKSQNAMTADGLSVACVNCVTSSQIQSVNGSAVTGTIPIASVPDLSAIYIQNTTNQQATSNFNISGDGTVGGTLSSNAVNATTQYNLGGQRLLSAPGTSNLFAGINTGAVTTGVNNVFVGAQAGQANTTGGGNAFFGALAGGGNTTGQFNAFFGYQAGNANTTVCCNSFFGGRAGQANTTGGRNSFFGYLSGFSNTAGSDNAFFGNLAGQFYTTGNRNSFFGSSAGAGSVSGSTGNDNSFFGYRAGQLIQNGSANSFFGSQAGQNNTTEHDNTFIGSNAGAMNGTNDQNNFANFNTFVGSSAGQANTMGNYNAFFGSSAGQANTVGAANTLVGSLAGFTNTTGTGNTLVGSNADVATGALTNATAIGYRATVGCNHCMVLGDPTDDSLRAGIGTSIPSYRLHVEAGSSIIGIYGNSSSLYGVYGLTDTGVGVSGVATGSHGIAVNGSGTSFFSGDTTPLPSFVGKGIAVGFSQSGAVGYIFAIDYNNFQPQTLALNHPGGRVGIGMTTPDQTLSVNGNASKPGGGSWAVFSDERLKQIKGLFTPGLQAVMQLQPVRYEYKRDNALGLRAEGEQIGFSAQAVRKLIPEAVSQNDKGYLLVNNDPILWAMLNAIKEQQAQISKQQTQNQQQQAQIKRQQNEIDGLKRLVCLDHPQAAICQSEVKP